jgi:hypothetical protein
VVERIAVGVVTLMVVAGWLAFWNPWHLVVVERVLVIPAVGVVMATVFGCAAAALPVPADSRSEFTPGKRVLAAFAVPVTSLQLWATVVPGWPTERHRELARSPDGQRTVVLHLSSTDTQCLYAWAGRGLDARVAGAFGKPGDNPVVTFEGRDLVVVWSDRPPLPSWMDPGPQAQPLSPSRREKVELRLDPATGRPLDEFRERCSRR